MCIQLCTQHYCCVRAPPAIMPCRTCWSCPKVAQSASPRETPGVLGKRRSLLLPRKAGAEAGPRRSLLLLPSPRLTPPGLRSVRTLRRVERQSRRTNNQSSRNKCSSRNNSRCAHHPVANASRACASSSLFSTALNRRSGDGADLWLQKASAAAARACS